MKKRYLALPFALLLIGSIGSTATAAVEPSSSGSGNPPCTGVKIEDPADGTYVTSNGTYIINVYQTALGPAFDWASPDRVVSAVTVKGGPAWNLFTYNPAVHFGHHLHSPVNPNNKHGFYYGLSHICFEGAKKAPGA